MFYLLKGDYVNLVIGHENCDYCVFGDHSQDSSPLANQSQVLYRTSCRALPAEKRFLDLKGGVPGRQWFGFRVPLGALGETFMETL